MIPQIITLSGKAGSGKDTIADFFVKHHKFKKISLADPLKHMCSTVFDFQLNDFYDRIKKEIPFIIPIIVSKEHLNKILSRASTITKNTKKIDFSKFEGTELKSIRHMLQWIGTDLLRDNFNDNIWIEALKNRLKHENKFIVADCRLENERNELKALGAINILINRKVDEIEQKDHISENSLGSEIDYDVIINNNDTILKVFSDLNLWYVHMRKNDVRN